MTNKPPENEEFTIFVKKIEPRLSVALAAAYGVDAGRESAADALLYAWEHWSTVQNLENPAGLNLNECQHILLVRGCCGSHNYLLERAQHQSENLKFQLN